MVIVKYRTEEDSVSVLSMRHKIRKQLVKSEILISSVSLVSCYTFISSLVGLYQWTGHKNYILAIVTIYWAGAMRQKLHLCIPSSNHFTTLEWILSAPVYRWVNRGNRKFHMAELGVKCSSVWLQRLYLNITLFHPSKQCTYPFYRTALFWIN